MHDVIIVGAGPVGLYLAHLLEEKLDVVILDKATVLGKKADSGLYSSHLEEFVPLKKEWIEHSVVGARLHSLNETISVEKPESAAHVVDRERFQQWLASRVKSDICLETKVESIDITDYVTVQTTKGPIQGSVVIGADGANSLVRKHFGVGPKEFVTGLIAITKEPNTGKYVDLFFDKKKIHDGFFWKIPRGQTTEYGALGTGVNFKDLESFFHLSSYEKRAAFMTTGLFPTAFSRALLVGEAAGQVKPWSFGGIIFGFTCARIARDVLFEAFVKKDFSLVQTYDTLWKEKIGQTIALGLRFRDQFSTMDNRTLDNYFRLFNKLPLSSLDMDFPKLELFG